MWPGWRSQPGHGWQDSGEREDEWVDDLVAFLRARLDEDEAVAKAAALGYVLPWTVISDEGDYPGCVADAEDRVVSDFNEADAAHIARYDPARVLREVKAKRAILDDWQHCSQGQYAIREASFYRSVVHLAAVYSDHPDYRQEWKP